MQKARSLCPLLCSFIACKAASVKNLVLSSKSVLQDLLDPIFKLLILAGDRKDLLEALHIQACALNSLLHLLLGRLLDLRHLRQGLVKLLPLLLADLCFSLGILLALGDLSKPLRR